MKSVVLRTSRLMLNTLRADDLMKLWKNGYNTTDMWVYFKRKISTYDEFERTYKRKVMECENSDSHKMAWCIRDIRTDTPYGMMDIHDDWEMSWSIATPYRGNGYCVEAARAVIYYMFAKQGADYVRAKVAKSDIPSMLVAEALGFKINSRGYMLNSNGVPIEQNFMTLFKEEYKGV